MIKCCKLQAAAACRQQKRPKRAQPLCGGGFGSRIATYLGDSSKRAQDLVCYGC